MALDPMLLNEQTRWILRTDAAVWMELQPLNTIIECIHNDS